MRRVPRALCRDVYPVPCAACPVPCALYSDVSCAPAAKDLCESLQCEHECRASADGGVCKCPEGKVLAEDGRLCEGEYTDYLVLRTQCRVPC